MDAFFEHAATIISLVCYKDWMFLVARDMDAGAYLQVRFSAPDSTDPGEPPNAWGSRKWRLSWHMTDSEIVQTALKAVLTAEEHEARERFTYKGRAIFGPHLNIEHLVRVFDMSAFDIRAPRPTQVTGSAVE